MLRRPCCEGKGEVSPLPLEVKLAGRPREPPLYGTTLDDAGLRNAKVALPFNAYGTLAMSHREDDVNSGEEREYEYNMNASMCMFKKKCGFCRDLREVINHDVRRA